MPSFEGPSNGTAAWRVRALALAAKHTGMLWQTITVHRLACLQVRDKQDCLRACTEDLANLTDHFNTVRAAKELAQKELAKVKRQVEEARHDWTRKIRERRAEVRASNMLLAYRCL